MSRYLVGNPDTREPHPDCPPEGFRWATEAARWIVARDLHAGWWPIPVEAEPQPARLEGTL